jgi:hypothetical protein
VIARKYQQQQQQQQSVEDVSILNDVNDNVVSNDQEQL